MIENLKMSLNYFAICALVLAAFSRADDFSSLKSYMNETADPCDDFYEYTCGNFKNNFKLSPEAFTVDQFTLLEERLTYLMDVILSVRKRHYDPVPLKKAKSAYISCMEPSEEYSDGIPEFAVMNGEGGFPLVEAESNNPIEYDWNDVADAISKYGIPMVFDIRILPSIVNATKNLIYISLDSLENPTLLKPPNQLTFEEQLERDLYETVTQKAKNKRSSKPLPFDVFLKKMADKLKRYSQQPASDEEIENRLEKMSDFMRGIYLGGVVPNNVTVKPLPEYTVTLEQLNEWTREHFDNSVQLDWIEFMSRIFSNSGVSIGPDTEIMSYIGLNRYLYGVLNWVNMHSANILKNFVMLRVFLYMAPDSDDETRSAFDEYYRQKNYVLYPRWKYCTRKIIDSVGSIGLSLAVTYEYVLRYYNVNAFTEVKQMVEDIQNVFKETLMETSWMDEKMKKVATDKLDNMITILGYPEIVNDKEAFNKFYENLNICKFDHYGNAQKLRAFKFAHHLSQLSKRDRTFWDRSPFETNAYYNRQYNKIILPVAMINPEFFGSNNGILNYGRLGSIIGHEVTHGFDVEGQKYDKDGALKPWSTHSNFTKYSKCFVDQYNKYYIPEINSYVNGTNTLNENLADNGGAKQSYKAMKTMVERLNLKLSEDSKFTMDQMFFIGFGTMWCSNPSQYYLNRMRNDLHTMSKWRVNGVVSNMKEFSEAFGCPIGSKMNPEKKCLLW